MKKQRNERTSARVARIAGELLAIDARPRACFWLFDERCHFHKIAWSKVKALAASALTQAPGKPKRKAKKRRG